MRSLERLVPLAAVILALIVLTSACERSQTSDPSTAGSFIAIAMESAEGKAAGLDLFPRKAETVKCMIPGGGPPPGIRVPGTCGTSVRFRGEDEATILFVQRWNAREFDADPGRAIHLSHTWEITIKRDSTDGEAVQIRDYGDFPPQLVR